MKVAVGRCPPSGAPLASQSTISRLENTPRKAKAARVPVAPFADAPKEGGGPDDKDAAQGFVASTCDDAEPDLPGRRVVLWCQPKPCCELAPGSEQARIGRIARASGSLPRSEQANQGPEIAGAAGRRSDSICLRRP
jgi:hypothetical protein